MEIDALYWMAIGLVVGLAGRGAVPGGWCISAPIAIIVAVGGALAGGLVYAAAVGYPVALPSNGVERYVPEMVLAVGGAMGALMVFSLATGRVELVQHSDPEHPFQRPVW